MSKIPEKFLCVILLDWCWVVHILFVHMVKLKFLAQFPMDLFTHLVVSTLIVILCLFAALFHLYHYITYSCLSILVLISLVLIALFPAAIRKDSVSLLRFPFFSHVHVFSGALSLIIRLKRPQSCFSYHICFLAIVVPLDLVSSVLFLVIVISLPSHFIIIIIISLLTSFHTTVSWLV